MQFHFDQSKVRSEIRLREGRVKPIDVLSKHLNVSDEMDIEIDEPYMVFKVNVNMWLLFFSSLAPFVILLFSFISIEHHKCNSFSLK